MATFVPFLIKAFSPAQTAVDYCTATMRVRLFCRKVGADNGSRAGLARQRSAGRVTRTGRGKKERKEGRGGEGRGADIKATQQGNYTAETQTPSFYVFE